MPTLRYSCYVILVFAYRDRKFATVYFGNL
jgi:hypothetical protein